MNENLYWQELNQTVKELKFYEKIKLALNIIFKGKLDIM